MPAPKNQSKLILFVLVALVGGFAGFGYFKQSSNAASSMAAATTPSMPEQSSEAARALLTMKPSDISLGDTNALITIVEYSSLSCPHCASFHTSILPLIEKEFITSGKVKLIVRHFPLNEPALLGAKIVECAGMNGLDRYGMSSSLFKLQSQWAFDGNPVEALKKIARVAGMDSAAVDSCLADKGLETRILAMRQEGDAILKVDATPSFFINGQKFAGELSAQGLREAINAVLLPGK